MYIMNSDDFRREIKKGLSGGYLFFGDEDYLKANALIKAREAICPEEAFAFFNDLRIDPLDLTPDALIDALAPLPMMSEQKLVSVSRLNFSSTTRSFNVDELVEAIDALDEYPYNVLIINVPTEGIDEGHLPKKPSALFTKLTKKLKPVRFSTPPEIKLIAWCEKHFEHNGVECSDEMCRLMFDKCGRSMFTLSSEIDKLSYYVLANGRNKICTDDVELVTCSVIEQEAFGLTNALLDGKNDKALLALEAMKYNKVEPTLILAEISNTICNLILTKAMLTDGKTYPEIVSTLRTLKISDFAVKLYMSGAASRSEERLERALALCAEADKHVKFSRGYDAIEQLLSSI